MSFFSRIASWLHKDPPASTVPAAVAPTFSPAPPPAPLVAAGTSFPNQAAFYEWVPTTDFSVALDFRWVKQGGAGGSIGYYTQPDGSVTTTMPKTPAEPLAAVVAAPTAPPPVVAVVAPVPPPTAPTSAPAAIQPENATMSSTLNAPWPTLATKIDTSTRTPAPLDKELIFEFTVGGMRHPVGMIVFNCGVNGWHVYLCDENGNSLREISAPGGSLVSAQFAFVVDRDPPDMWTVSLSSGSRRQIRCYLISEENNASGICLDIKV